MPNGVQPKDPDDRSWLSRVTVKEVWPVVTIVGSLAIGAASTFFATRVAIEGRLSTLEAKVAATEKLRAYTDAAFVHHQLNSLLVLKDEFRRLEQFFDKWTEPQFLIGTRGPGWPKNVPDSTIPVVVDRKDAPMNYNLGTDMSEFYRIVSAPQFTALADSSFVAKTNRVYISLIEFHAAVKEDVTATGGAFRASNASPFLGMPQKEAEERVKAAKEYATALRELLKGMSDDAERLRQATEKTLPTSP